MSGDSPFLHGLKKKAISFLQSKVRTARLALTDVTPAELLTEEAITQSPSGSGPDTRTMRIISRAAFEVGDYWRIVDVLHKRFSRFDGKRWKESYKALVLLEYLLTHGPVSVAEEFEIDSGVIRDAGAFRYIDDSGFNWGLAVRKKSERVLKLLEKGPFLKQERERCRKLTRGIEGFGSMKSSTSTILSSIESHQTSHKEESSVQDDEKENVIYTCEEKQDETQREPFTEKANCSRSLPSKKKKVSTPMKTRTLEELKPLLEIEESILCEIGVV